MSNGQYGEKTEQATPHRLREARRKGQVVKSHELTSAIPLLAVAFLFVLSGADIFRRLQELVGLFYGEYLVYPVTMENLPTILRQGGLLYFRVMALIFFTVLASGLLINYAQVGFIFSTDRLSLSLDKLNPLEGFKRIISRRALFELFKALFKITVVGIAAYYFLLSRFNTFLGYMFLAPEAIFGSVYSEALSLTLQVALILVILAVLDYIYQRYEHYKNLRMTRQEVKEEHKQMEGDPLLRSKLREKQRSMAMRRMMQDVPAATVVVTNPTELAVALKYSAEEAPVPVVVAKGAGMIAARIRELAVENKVPVIENKPVARMLYEQVEIGMVIPADLYRAVAEILALVLDINKNRGGKN